LRSAKIESCSIKKSRKTTEKKKKKAPKVADKITGEYNGKVYTGPGNIILMQTEIKRIFKNNNLQTNIIENCSK
jgi:hypothetical protein